MHISRWRGPSYLLAVLLGATLVGTCPLWAQDQPPKHEANPQVPFLIRSHLVGLNEDKPIQALIADYDSQALNDLLVANLVEPTDELLGASLQPVSDLLRS